VHRYRKDDTSATMAGFKGRLASLLRSSCWLTVSNDFEKSIHTHTHTGHTSQYYDKN